MNPHQDRAAMRNLSIFVFVVVLLAPGAAMSDTDTPKSAHDFTFEAIEGGPLPLSQYNGQAVMIVNTASFCGFTPQYEGLQNLWQTYRDRGLVVLGVPSNDFGGQEPKQESEIKDFCEVNFNIDFPLTTKTQVKGDKAHPFYQWASKELGVLAKPRWNFHKYLIDPDGRLVGWFSSPTKPNAQKVIKAVEAVLPER